MSWNLIQWSEQTSNIMATMTYKELLEELKQLNEEQLKKNVAIFAGALKFLIIFSFLPNLLQIVYYRPLLQRLELD